MILMPTVVCAPGVRYVGGWKIWGWAGYLDLCYPGHACASRRAVRNQPALLAELYRLAAAEMVTRRH